MKDLIIYSDEDLVVVNKKAGVLSIPDGYAQGRENLRDILTVQFKEIFVVHRIDAETSGVMVFAKNEAAHRALSMQFERHEVLKVYHALLEGRLSASAGSIDFSIAAHPSKHGVMQVNNEEGKESLTEYSVLQQFKNYTYVEARPKTGRTHQIRVHFAALGFPLAVDHLYGSGRALLLSAIKKNFKAKEGETERPLLARLGLHASSIEFKHPSTGEEVKFEAKLPKDLAAAVKQLSRVR